MKDLTKYIMGVASKSNVEKRQVGCLITFMGDIVSEGYNVIIEGKADVHAEIMALEVLVAESFIHSDDYKDLELHITHQPCPACARAIASYGITKVHIVEAFMKFDGDKTRYDLVDGEFGIMLRHAIGTDTCVPSLLFDLEQQLRLGVTPGQGLSTLNITEASVLFFNFSDTTEMLTSIAEVLTFGARKYKPNNWRQCEDYGRYLAAAWRHHLAEDETDEESGLLHRSHFMTNIMFLHTKLVQIRDEKNKTI